MHVSIVFIKILCKARREASDWYLLEFNTLPGLTPATCIFHQAAEIGLKPMDFIDKIIELGFEEHTQQYIQRKGEQVLADRL